MKKIFLLVIFLFCCLGLAFALAKENKNLGNKPNEAKYLGNRTDETIERYKQYYNLLPDIRSCKPGVMADVDGMVIIDKTKDTCHLAAGRFFDGKKEMYHEYCDVPFDKYKQFVDLHEMNAKMVVENKTDNTSLEIIYDRIRQAHRFLGHCLLVD